MGVLDARLVLLMLAHPVSWQLSLLWSSGWEPCSLGCLYVALVMGQVDDSENTHSHPASSVLPSPKPALAAHLLYLLGALVLYELPVRHLLQRIRFLRFTFWM